MWSFAADKCWDDPVLVSSHREMSGVFNSLAEGLKFFFLSVVIVSCEVSGAAGTHMGTLH